MLALNQKILLVLYGFAHKEGPFQNIIHWTADSLDIWVIVLLLLWFLYRAWKKQRTSGRLICFSCFHEVIMVILTGWLAWGAASIVKILVNTARPFAVRSLEVIPLFVPMDPWSFPSGHTALFVALGIISWFHDRTVGVMVLVAAGLIGLTRVMSGVHFPLDILGGAIIAGIIVGLLMFFDKQHLHRIS